MTRAEPHAEELGRVLGLDGLRRTAKRAVRSGRAREFANPGPDEGELRRRMGREGPFFAWARGARPELHARPRSSPREETE